ncbi:MAG: hypothetical protein GX319_04605 [Clostridiales bacterium]|nr:hypothetical protein [Bacillota bacterium]NLK03675.1 hypothetical protein [Clostridiales bacterium]
MGRYSIIVKTEEVRRRVQAGKFDSAMKVVETIPLKKVRNIADLSLFAEIYSHNKKYEEAMELLERVYKKSKTRRVLYQMVLVSIGKKNILDAERYLEEYKEVAPKDLSIYIFRYKIDKLKKEPYEVLIESLRKLKDHTYMEKWAYELAKLYYKAGMEEECIQECSDLILWFGVGSYVEKAKILRAYYSGEVAKEEIIDKLKKRVSGDNSLSEQENPTKSEEVEPTNKTPLENLEDNEWKELSENVGKEVEELLADEQSELNNSDQKMD